MELPLQHNANVVVWSDNLNEKMLLMELTKPNLHFVRTNHERELIETIRKVKTED